MSYILTPSSGLQTVAVDGTTIEGDGTPADPLVAVIPPASLTDNVSAYRTADSAPLTSPFTAVLDTTTVYTADPAFTGTSVAFNGAGFGGLEFTVAGTYKVTMQVSYETLPAGSKTDLQTEITLADAPAFGTTIVRSRGSHHLDTGDTARASLSLTKTFVIPAPTFYYLTFDAQSPLPIDIILKGDPTLYAYVEVLRLA